MKVWLDDCRPAPSGWVWVKWPRDAIRLLQDYEVTHLSLDHDLGNDEVIGTGYDVVLWLEEKAHTKGTKLPSSISIHTANSSARTKMQAGVDSILRQFTF